MVRVCTAMHPHKAEASDQAIKACPVTVRRVAQFMAETKHGAEEDGARGSAVAVEPSTLCSPAIYGLWCQAD